MKKNLSLIIAFLYALISFAQTATFDMTTYKVPNGWTKSTKQGLVTYSTSVEAKRTYCIINLYASASTIGNAGEEFVKYWNEYAATPFNIKEEPETEKAEDDGYEIISGAANFISGKITSLAMLTVIVGYGRTTCVLSLTNDESYQQDIQDFLSSLDIKKKTPASVTPTVTKTASTTTNTANTFHNTNALEGVWNGMNINTSDFNYKSGGGPIWLVFFDNGKVSNMFPDNMGTFNKNAGDLGTYQISKGGGNLQWYSGTATTGITFKSNDQILVNASTGDQNYFRCKSVDGARLEGSWTTYSNPNDADLDAAGAKSLITFSKNGTFIDDGIYSNGIEIFAGNKTQPGSGTYSINNFTLTLNYSNGITKQSSFCGFVSNDVNINNATIFIDSHKLRKR